MDSQNNGKYEDPVKNGNKDSLIVKDNKILRFEDYVGLDEIHRHWGWFLAVGCILIMLGVLAMGAAGFTTLFSMIFLGTILLVGGIVQAVNAIRTRKGDGFLVNVLAAILYIVMGILLIMNPAIAAITLTLLLAAFYTVSGLFKIIAAISNRFAHWGWMLFSGIVSLILGLLFGRNGQYPAFGSSACLLESI
jgi:uncharacterized membrane protein HdeD (DUF308 family)